MAEVIDLIASDDDSEDEVQLLSPPAGARRRASTGRAPAPIDLMSPEAPAAFAVLREAGETLADERLRADYDRRERRRREVRRATLAREIRAAAETAAEYVQCSSARKAYPVGDVSSRRASRRYTCFRYQIGRAHV